MSLNISGTLSWFINFDVVTGQVIEPSWGSTRSEEDALAHLQRLIESDPQATKWHLMLDNLNIHQSEALVRWIAQREGIAQETLGVKGKSGILRSMESRTAFLHDPTHQVRSLPLPWTSLALPDPFLVVAAGRTMLRFEDIGPLNQLLKANPKEDH